MTGKKQIGEWGREKAFRADMKKGRQRGETCWCGMSQGESLKIFRSRTWKRVKKQPSSSPTTLLDEEIAGSLLNYWQAKGSLESLGNEGKVGYEVLEQEWNLAGRGWCLHMWRVVNVQMMGPLSSARSVLLKPCCWSKTRLFVLALRQNCRGLEKESEAWRISSDAPDGTFWRPCFTCPSWTNPHATVFNQ